MIPDDIRSRLLTRSSAICASANREIGGDMRLAWPVMQPIRPVVARSMASCEMSSRKLPYNRKGSMIVSSVRERSQNPPLWNRLPRLRIRRL